MAILWHFICSMTQPSREDAGLQHFMAGAPECCSLLKEWEFFFFFFPRLRQQSAGKAIKTSWWLDAVTLRYCSISVMAELPSIFACLSRFRTQKSNYGLLYIKALICYCGEGQRASFVCCPCTRRKGQRSAGLCISQCSQLCILTFTDVKSYFLKWLWISHNKCQQVHNSWSAGFSCLYWILSGP